MKNPIQSIPTKFLARSLGLSVAALSLLGSHSAMAANVTMTAGDPGGTTSFNTAGKWNVVAAPSSGNAYFTGAFEMRGIAPATFAGDSLSLDAGGGLHGKMNGTLTFTNGTGLFLNGGAIYQANSGGSNSVFGIAGTITANSGTTTTLGSTTGESLDISGTIGGSGNLTIAGTAIAQNLQSFVTFDGANTISGTVSVVTPSGGSIENATKRLLNLNNLNSLQNATLALTGGNGQANLVSFSSAGTYNIGALSGAANQALTNTSGTAVAISVGSNNASTTYSGVLSGAGSLTKVGTGTLTLSGPNTYTGITTVSSGVLQITNDTALGTTAGATSIAAGAQVLLNANSMSVAENFTLNGTTSGGALVSGDRPGGNVNTLSGIITLNADSNVASWWNDKTMTFSGKITGAGGLTFDRATSLGNGDPFGGKFILSNATNDYAGNTVVNGRPGFGNAILQLGATNALPTSTTLTLNSATLSLSGFNQTLSGLVGASPSTVVNGAATAVTLTVNNSSANTFGGVLGGGGTDENNFSLTKGGAGTLTLSGASSYAGTTTVQNGSLIAGAAVAVSTNGAFGNAATAIALGDATSISNNLSPSLLIGGAFTMARDITVGSSNSATSGTYTIGGSTANSATFSGTTTLNQSLAVTQISGGTLNLTGNITSGASGTQTVTFNNAGSVSQSTGVIGGGTGTIAVTQSGAGTTTLTASNSYSGGTTVNAGVVAFSSTLVSGSNSNLGTGNITLNGGTLRYTGADVPFYSAHSNYARTITVGGGGGTFDTTNSGSDFSTDFVLAGSGTLTKIGSRALELNVAASGFTGNVNVNAGALWLQTGAALGTGTNTVTVANGANLNLSTFGGFTISQSIVLNGTGSDGNGALQIGLSPFGTMGINGSVTLNTDSTIGGSTGGANALQLNGAVIGSGALTKVGTSTLTLTNANTYTGATTISNGILQIGDGGTTGTLGSGAVADSASLVFNRSNTLTVTNDISGAGTVKNAGGASNILNLNGAQNYAILYAESGTTNVNGSFTSGTSIVNANANVGFYANQSLAQLNIADGVVVNLGGVPPSSPEMAMFAASAPVPEPGSLSLLLLGVLGFLGRRRRSA